jgi:ABC-type sugar transport system ATPase subunit
MQRLMASTGLHVDLDARAGDLPVGDRQRLEILKALHRGARVLILDEPTAALGVRESRKVLDLIAQLRAEGNAVIIITHNMQHVVELADRAVVLRQGSKVGELKPSRTSQQELVSMIVGAEV